MVTKKHNLKITALLAGLTIVITSLPARAQNTSSRVKLRLETNQYVPKNPLQNLERTKLIQAPLTRELEKTKHLDKTKSLNIVPVLNNRDNSFDYDKERESEIRHISSLWQATIENSPDVNMVLQRLVPSSDTNRLTTSLIMLLNTAVYGGLGTLRIVSPGVTSGFTSSLAASIYDSLVKHARSGKARQARISEVEQVLLFKMLRETADQLAFKYRTLKNNHRNLALANEELLYLKSLTNAIREDQNYSEQFKSEYELRKQKRKIETLITELEKNRLALITLAGEKAVYKVEVEIKDCRANMRPQYQP